MPRDMLIDSHSHLHFPVYKDDLENVLTRMKEKNVVTLTVGTSVKNSIEAVEFSKKYGIACSIGFHPSHARPAGVSGYLDPTEEVYDEEFDEGKLREILEHNPPRPDATSGHPSVGGELDTPLLRGGRFDDGCPVDTQEAEGRGVFEGLNGNVAAIGECGLDYFRLPHDPDFKKQFKQKQREVFEAQIGLAREFNLPLIVHTRASKEDPTDAYQDTYEILKQSTVNSQQKGVMHCFLGSKDWAKKFLELGFFLSFGGILTFKKADEIRESARFCPHDMILTETDCPYLAPEPHRGEQNEPAYVEFVLRKLEEVRVERLEERVEENFNKLFRN